jgi:hypothetical protein
VLDHLDAMALGVAVARRGWLEAASVVNTGSVSELRAWLERKGAAGPAPAGRRSGKAGGS